MTKAQLKSKVSKMVWQVAPYLGMDRHWTFTATYKDKIEPDINYGIVGGCESLWEYKQCALIISVDAVKDYSDRELRSFLTHELLHAVLQEMREWGNGWESLDGDSKEYKSKMKHEEHVVTMMTAGYMEAFDKIFKDNNGKANSKDTKD